MGGEDRLVKLLEEFHRFQVLLAAETVGDPFPVPPVVIQVQHGGHRVHPDAVHVKDLQPIHGVGYQEAAHLRTAVVEHAGAPFLVFALAGIGVFVAGPPVEMIQAALILGEMRCV